MAKTPNGDDVLRRILKTPPKPFTPKAEAEPSPAKPKAKGLKYYAAGVRHRDKTKLVRPAMTITNMAGIITIAAMNMTGLVAACFKIRLAMNVSPPEARELYSIAPSSSFAFLPCFLAPKLALEWLDLVPSRLAPADKGHGLLTQPLRLR